MRPADASAAEAGILSPVVNRRTYRRGRLAEDLLQHFGDRASAGADVPVHPVIAPVAVLLEPNPCVQFVTDRERETGVMTEGPIILVVEDEYELQAILDEALTEGRICA